MDDVVEPFGGEQRLQVVPGDVQLVQTGRGGDVGGQTGAEVVDDDDFAALGKQIGGDVGADEAGPAGDEYLHGSPPMQMGYN